MESRRKMIYKKNLKQTACVPFFLLQVTVKAITGREKRGGNHSRPPLFVELSCGGAWRRLAAIVPTLFPRIYLFFCNFQTLLCIFRLLVFDLF
jgi:hypothetical protein